MTTATLDATFYGNVNAGLRQAVRAVNGAPPDDHWALENRTYQPQDTDPWLRWTFRPQVNRLASVGTPTTAYVRHIGAVLVDYFIPEGTGTTAADTFASAVLTALHPGTYLTYNGQLVIIRSCFANGGIEDGQFYQRPITIGWTADTLSTS